MGARRFFGLRQNPSHHRNYRRLTKGSNGATYLQRFPFQLVRLLFLVIKDPEQGKGTEIQGLADVGRMRHESEQNDSLRTCIGDDARSKVTGMRVNQKDNWSIVVSFDG
jgi:hypothetical protein